MRCIKPTLDTGYNRGCVLISSLRWCPIPSCFFIHLHLLSLVWNWIMILWYWMAGRFVLTWCQRLRDKVFAATSIYCLSSSPQSWSHRVLVLWHARWTRALCWWDLCCIHKVDGPTTPVSCRRLRDRNRGSVCHNKPVERLLPISIDSNADEPWAIWSTSSRL